MIIVSGVLSGTEPQARLLFRPFYFGPRLLQYRIHCCQRRAIAVVSEPNSCSAPRASETPVDCFIAKFRWDKRLLANAAIE